MALPFQRLSLHATTFYSTVVVACAAQVAVVVIVFLLSHTTSIASEPIGAIGIGAAVLDIFSVVSTAALAALYLRRVSRKILVLCCGLVIVAAGAAALMTIYTLARIRTGSYEAKLPSRLQQVSLAGVVVWVVAIVTQMVFYTIVLWPDCKSEYHFEDKDLSQTPSPMRSIKKSLPVHLIVLSSPLQTPRSQSEQVSKATPSRPLSLRPSAHQALKQVTSRSRLIRAQSSGSHDSLSVQSVRETPSAEFRRDDDFETWDTSGVEDTMETIYTPRNRWTRLETIPGSRPVSPAKPLDGPFKQEHSAEETSLPSSPSMTLPDLPSPALSPPGADPDFLRSVPAPNSRRLSGAGKTHIHPLFRTGRPAPPPLASPGTVITASPYAGQVVGPEHAFHGSARKLHCSPRSRADSMYRTHSKDRSDSVGSFRAVSVSSHKKDVSETRPVASEDSLEQAG